MASTTVMQSMVGTTLQCQQLRPRLPARRSLVVRAEKITDKIAEAAKQQGQQIKETVIKPLAEGQDATSTNARDESGWDKALKQAGSVEKDRVGYEGTSFPDAMRFRGPAPEIINCRLGMIGITTGWLGRTLTGKNVYEQIQAAPIPVALTFLTIIVASFVPILRDNEADKKYTNSIWNIQNEKTIGRIALIGWVILLAQDAWGIYTAANLDKVASMQ